MDSDCCAPYLTARVRVAHIARVSHGENDLCLYLGLEKIGEEKESRELMEVEGDDCVERDRRKKNRVVVVFGVMQSKSHVNDS